MPAKSYIAKKVVPDGGRSRRQQPRFVEEFLCNAPRYFFHVKRGQVTVLDHDGVALPSLEDAAKEAMRRAHELASNVSPQDESTRRMIIIADSEWRTMIEVPF